MQTLIITFALFVLVRTLLWRNNRQSADGRLSTSIKNELSAWLLTALALIAAFLLLFVFTLFLGPIPPVHEWGSN